MPELKTKKPLLWRTKSSRTLRRLGQLDLPGLGISDSRTESQAWLELESATSRESGRHAPPGIEQ